MWMSVDVVSGVRIVQCHAIIDVAIGVRVMLCHQAMDKSGFSTFLNFPLRVQFSSCRHAVLIHHHFSVEPFCAHFCTAKTCHLRCGIYRFFMGPFMLLLQLSISSQFYPELWP